MAKPLSFVSTFFVLLTIPLISSSATAESPRFSRSESPKSFGLRQEKLSHLHFYFQDTMSGPNPSAVRVAEATITNRSSSLFGMVVVMDTPLTVGPDPKSELVGRAQGLYASASQSEFAFLMAMNFKFEEGKYNGSTLSVMGRNVARAAVREMPIVGGSGLFRFARGYVEARTYTVDFNKGDAIVEYNVYVLHY